MKDLFSLDDKTALVTGGTSGIGRMIAEGFVRSGAKVYVASRKEEACAKTAEALSEFGQCFGIPANLSTEKGCIALAEEFGKNEESIDILVNNAGATWGDSFENFPAKAWDRILDLNLKGPFFLTRALVPMLEKAGSPEDPSRIINITSIAGTQTDSIQAYAYGPSKAGLNHMTRMLAKEFISKNINVNAIAPGFFPSKMTSYLLTSPENEQQLAQQIPMKRLGKMEDMAGLSTFLCSPAASYITGVIIPLDGGLLVQA